MKKLLSFTFFTLMIFSVGYAQSLPSPEHLINNALQPSEVIGIVKSDGTVFSAAGASDITTAGGVVLSSINQPYGVAGLDSNGVLNTSPISSVPGVADASIFGVSSLIIPRAMTRIGNTTVGSANEFSVSLQATTAVTNALANYEKAVLYLNNKCSDPSDTVTPITRDCVGVESQVSTTVGNMTGRIWSYDSISTIVAGSDAYASGLEMTINNNGADQANINTFNQKNGIHLVGAGLYGGTAAILPDGKWHDGLICQYGVITEYCLKVFNGASVVASLDPTGALVANSFTLVGGGTSTASFSNNCLNTTGVAYLGACVNGANNAISGQYSLVGGNAASDQGEYGRSAFSGSAFGHAAGDSQWGWRVLSGTIPTSGTVRLTSNGGNAATATSIYIGNGKALGLDCKLVAHKYGGQDSAAWTLNDALFDMTASLSTARLVGGSWTQTFASSGASGLLTPSITADTTYGAVNISVTATSGGPWDITARCFSTEAR